MLLPDSKTELVRRGNKVVYDLGDKIVKVFNETKPVSDVFNEALNLARINECGIRSPPYDVRNWNRCPSHTMDRSWKSNLLQCNWKLSWNWNK